MVIPTLGNRDSLPPLVECLARDPRLLVIIADTSPERRVPLMGYGQIATHVIRVDREPININRWWNEGLRYGRRISSAPAAILNDDVEVRDSSAVVELADNAAGGISYLTPPWDPRETPMTGYAFGIDPSVIWLDEEYQWWWSEHDLYLRAATQGLTVAGVERSDDIRHLRTDWHYHDLQPHRFAEMRGWDISLFHGRWAHLAPSYDVVS